MNLSLARSIRVVMSAAAIGCVTWICYRAFGANAITAGFAYLLCVLAIAANWGMIEALVASAAATTSLVYFFLPPIGRFVIANPSDWLALVSFVTTALVASHLSDRAKKEAEEARTRARESGLLYQLSRATLLSDARESAGLETARNLARIFHLSAVHLYDVNTGEMFHAGDAELRNPQLDGIEARLREAAKTGSTIRMDEANVLIAPVGTGDQRAGSVALQGLAVTPEALQSLLNLVAIAFERVRAQQASNRAEAARQSEEFKSTLLDAIAHEFKTPLTSIKAAATSILIDVPDVAPQIHELAAIIDHGADRLNLLVTDAVRMAQMDASMMELELQPMHTRDFINRVLELFRSRWEDRDVRFQFADNLPRISADPDLASMALRQVIDNALKYSSPGTPLSIAADADGKLVSIRIRDYGAGIAESERKSIFERFYREPSMKNQVPGSGLGLYVAREIARAHGGDLWAEHSIDSGAEFCMTLLKASESVPS